MTHGDVDEVIAESWWTDGDRVVVQTGPDLEVGGTECAADFPSGARGIGATRAAVSVLGKRALVLVLEHEWSAAHVCPGCDGVRPGMLRKGHPAEGHQIGCAWGALCDEVRKMRGVDSPATEGDKIT